MEAEYLDWHFSVWGHRTGVFAMCFSVLALGNLGLVLSGSSTRARALAIDGSSFARGSLVVAPILGVLFAAAALLLFSRTSYYNRRTHQVTTVLFLVVAFAIDTGPRVAYAESGALEPGRGGLCNTTSLQSAELTSLAANDAASFAYAQCLNLGAVAALAGLRPTGCTIVVAFMAFLGDCDQNAMAALCFGAASPRSSSVGPLPALVASCALAFALSDRFRREFVLQLQVQLATLERARQGREARDWARRLQGTKHPSSETGVPVADRGGQQINLTQPASSESEATNSEVAGITVEGEWPTSPKLAAPTPWPRWPKFQADNSQA